MSMFTRVGLYVIGAFFLMVGTARAEAVPYFGTAEAIHTFNLAEGAGTFRVSYSGLSNISGKYLCTGTGTQTLNASGSCGSDAVGYSVSFNNIECTSESVDYPFSVDMDDTEVCIPRQCHSPEPPHPLVVGCSYEASRTGSVMGSDGVTKSIVGSMAATDTYTIRWVKNNGVTSKFRVTATTSGTTDLNFIREEEPRI